MHVTFISMCEKTSIARTQRLLDRYSVRIGKGVWQSRFTSEALDDVYRTLKAGASKTTSVACYVNEGYKQMRLLWVVGNRKHFQEDGALAIGKTQRKGQGLPPWVRTAALIARTAGLNHDIGKATTRFQSKLRDALKCNRPLGDLIRHEWMSLAVYDEWMKAMKQWEAEGSTGEKPRLHEAFVRFNPAWTPTFFPKRGRGGRTVSPIDNAVDAVRLVTLTHHRLLSSGEANDYFPGRDGHYRNQEQYTDQTIDMYRETFNGATFDPSLEGQLWSLTKRTRDRGDDRGLDADYWKAIALIARIAVIAADHDISGKDQSQTSAAKARGKLFANTSSKSNTLNQSLDWHLRNVSGEAGNWVQRIATSHDFSGLSDQTREMLLRRSGHPDFAWQDRAADALRETSDDTSGALVFNMAGTGSGKTLANLKLAEALTPENSPCRVSIGLNLRSLTLQTSSSLTERTGLQSSEVTCLMGDTFPADAKKAFSELNADNDETPPGDMEIVGEGVGEGPDWLGPWACRQRNPRQIQQYLTTPCLVSTIDYLVQAGDPSRQGHHVKAALRIANSDLILDEIDNYDGKALVAISRIVMMSALFGRSVIVSSATLTGPVAEAIATAYRSGYRMRQALEGASHTDCQHQNPRIAFVDNMLPPAICENSDFRPQFGDRVERLMEEVRAAPEYRRGYIQPVALDGFESPIDCFANSVCEAIDKLHHQHSWTDRATGKTVSFGVVRVANIKPCIALTKILTGHGYIVNTYHSEDLKGRRWLKERQLDAMFSRGDDPDAPIRDPEIRQHIESAESDHVVFVLVATPVEEVGRDHDFDWAVIEPSSVASIVQMSGRVNRHRKVVVDSPNVAVIDRNLRSLKGFDSCFMYPGNGISYSLDEQPLTHCLRPLPTTHSDGTFPINAMLQFGSHDLKPRLAKDDEESCEKRMRAGLNGITGGGRSGSMALAWTSTTFYRDFPLRDQSSQMLRVRFVSSDEGDWGAEEYQVNSRNSGAWVKSPRIKLESSSSEKLWGTSSFDKLADTFRDVEEPLKSISFESTIRTSKAPDEEICFDELLGGR